jgi:glycosyltransferase involved in cell wall biosynthesis
MGNNVSVIPLILNQTYIPTNAGFIGWILKHLFAGLFVAYRAFKMLAKQSFDVIHAHGNLSALIISFFKRGSPLIYTVHDSTPWVRYYTSKFEEIIRKLAFICIELPAWKRADHIIAVNKGIQREAVRFRVSKDKCSVIPSGVATQQSKPMSS